MNPLWATLQRAALDWEALIPIAFFVLYGLAQFLGQRKKGAAAEEEEAEDGVDPAERTRQIREEIRRKIEERRHPPHGGEREREQRPSYDTRPLYETPAYDPNLPDSRQRRPQSAPTVRPVVQPSSRPAAPQPANPVFMSDAAPSIEARLREQRKRLDDARKEQQEAQSRAMEIERQADLRYKKEARRRKSAAVVVVVGPGPLRPQLLAGLRDPNALRNAILYREILGPPTALK